VGELMTHVDGRKVMALVDDHLAVARYEIGDGVSSHEALHHRYVKLTVRAALRPRDNPDGFSI